MARPADEMLASGMTGREAVARAERWWDDVGRGLVSREFTKQRKRRMNGGTPGVPLMIVKEEEIDAFSGILAGKPWRDLKEHEQLRVTHVWHHHHVLVPMQAHPSPLRLQ